MRAYGWQTNGRTVVPAEAEEIRHWADYLLADTDPRPSLRGLAVELQQRGVATVSGGPWRPLVIRRAITAPRMIGRKLDADGDLVAADMDPILDEREWHRLRDRLLDPELQKYAPTRASANLLSGGLADCGNCGKVLAYNGGSSGKHPTAVSCSLRGGGCGKVSIFAELIEADVTERVLARLTDPAYRRKLAKAVVKLTHGGDPAAVVDDIRARLAALGEDYADGKIERETMHAGTEKARANLARAERASGVVQVVEELDALEVDEILAWWEDATVERQRELIMLLLDHVTVRTSEGRTVVGADRLDYHWHN